MGLTRVDLIAQSRDTTVSLCSEAGLNVSDFQPVFVLDKKSMYFAFHKETSDAVIQRFQTAFDELSNDGEVAEIFKKYGK